MRVAVFSSKPYDKRYLGAAAEGSGHVLDYFEARLNIDQAPLADGYDGVCAFVHDELDADVLRRLDEVGFFEDQSLNVIRAPPTRASLQRRHCRTSRPRSSPTSAPSIVTACRSTRSRPTRLADS